MPNPIFNTASDLLGVVEDVFTTAGIALPDRRYVTFGEVALDCELCVVSITLGRHGTADEASSGLPSFPGSPFTRSLDMDVWVIRCVPTLTDDEPDKIPTAEALLASAEELTDDAWTLWSGLKQKHTDGSLMSGCTSVFFGDLNPYGPEGGMGGSTLSLSIQL